MPQKPPAWTPSDGTIGQIPIAISQTVDTAGVAPGSGQDAHVLAEQIVRQNQPIINRFVARQRQQVEISGRDVYRAMIPLEDMDVYYSNIQGLERMYYYISPQAEAPAPLAEVPEPEVPTAPSLPAPEPAPEVPEAPEPPEVPELEAPEPPEVPEVPEPEEEEAEKKPGEPDFLMIDVPFGLSVEFGDGAGNP